MKNWKTTLFGALAALPSLLQGTGVGSFGHVGGASISGLIGGVGVLLMGLFAKDKEPSN